eukprot:scaffold37814_cov101-Skeletonema_marinoi.AAC.2
MHEIKSISKLEVHVDQSAAAANQEAASLRTSSNSSLHVCKSLPQLILEVVPDKICVELLKIQIKSMSMEKQAHVT